jgi:hypothetical protein
MTREQAALLKKAYDSLRGAKLRFARTGVVPAEFHRYLINGQDMRTVGDYSTGPGLTTAQPAEQIARAERFLDQADRLLRTLPISSTEETSPTN